MIDYLTIGIEEGNRVEASTAHENSRLLLSDWQRMREVGKGYAARTFEWEWTRHLGSVWDAR